MSVIDRQVVIRIELTLSNNDQTNSLFDEKSLCENIQVSFPLPDLWFELFRTEKRFRYAAIHNVRRRAEKIKVNSLLREIVTNENT